MRSMAACPLELRVIRDGDTDMKDAVVGLTSALHEANAVGVGNMTISARMVVEICSYIEELQDITKAVAHVGVDFGYGEFKLEKEHIDKARELYERSV